ncbi:WbqC family protein [Pseudomonas sp. NUPR-001]|uniref:WbqC family protein n=1 Tax=Pseudomonas sp. NUPR-001 TaxID=3416058 RepID=UPI003F98F08E
MKLAVMQPYLFPYAGYFKLLAQVDRFVFFDDVNYINRGWINRNRLILSGEIRYFTVPLLKASQNLKINQIAVQDRTLWERKILESVRQSYAKAPNFADVFDLMRDVFSCDAESIADLARVSIEKSCERLGLGVEFVKTSAVYANADLKGAERILDICRKEGANEYMNLPGGRSLYDERQFSDNGIRLEFCSSDLPVYTQFQEAFVPGLSVIDMMMFNDFDECGRLLIKS